MLGRIRVAIFGVGNCASALVQGIYYARANGRDNSVGVMHWDIGGYTPADIDVVAAFDIDARKVGRELTEAIFAPPNCTRVFFSELPKTGVRVLKGKQLDGVASHMTDETQVHSFRISDEGEVDVVEVLRDSGAEIALNYLPVGSEKAARFYAECCLKAGVAFINCMPTFIASDPQWERRFRDAGVPIVGDDIKSQLGATIVHRTLAKLFADRGVKIERTYQINVGGNSDFLNMLARERLKSKKISKTQAVQSVLEVPLKPDRIHIGPSDYIPWLGDNKVCFIRIEGRLFGGVPMEIELRLSVEDSPNSAGCVVDAIRCCKLALDRGVSGVLTSASAYFMKHPPQQFPDNIARRMLHEFIVGERER